MIRPMEVNSEEEWLVAQRAVAVQREVSRAARAAEPGRGLMETEAMVHEHVHDCAKGIWGEGSTATDWADEQILYVLRHGGFFAI